jgi:predicted DNA-binding antitoxin AbrB/MazE fold protein
MSESIDAIYKNGVFVPEGTVDFPDGSKVQMAIELKEDSNGSSREYVEEFLIRASRRVISIGAPSHLTREELHERG